MMKIEQHMKLEKKEYFNEYSCIENINVHVRHIYNLHIKLFLIGHITILKILNFFFFI